MSPGFDDYFECAQVDIFRLETLQSYGNSGEDPALAAFQAGEPQLITRPNGSGLHWWPGAPRRAALCIGSTWSPSRSRTTCDSS